MWTLRDLLPPSLPDEMNTAEPLVGNFYRSNNRDAT